MFFISDKAYFINFQFKFPIDIKYIIHQDSISYISEKNFIIIMIYQNIHQLNF